MSTICLIDWNSGGAFPTHIAADYDIANQVLSLSGEWGNDDFSERKLQIFENDYIEKIVELGLPYESEVKRLIYELAKIFKKKSLTL